ncbi:hypothetical protein, partial [Staphylococcus pseudintermedius]|uniref:hypothetical protein n=1 Tax=Staphylococcus pseudintermedius TaxID=283734 RepID=UPI0036F44E88
YTTGNASRGGGDSSPLGRSDIGSLKVYCGRLVSPSKGDLILQIGWDSPVEDIYRKGRVAVLNNILQVRDINWGTATQVTYL